MCASPFRKFTVTYHLCSGAPQTDSTPAEDRVQQKDYFLMAVTVSWVTQGEHNQLLLLTHNNENGCYLKSYKSILDI